jgi:hypothetical protein
MLSFPLRVSLSDLLAPFDFLLFDQVTIGLSSELRRCSARLELARPTAMHYISSRLMNRQLQLQLELGPRERYGVIVHSVTSRPSF